MNTTTHRVTNVLATNLICNNNTYRNLTNCYHHPAGSFTTISAAIARVVYRHTCLMPCANAKVYHVCVWSDLFLLTSAANKLDVNYCAGS